MNMNEIYILTYNAAWEPVANKEIRVFSTMAKMKAKIKYLKKFPNTYIKIKSGIYVPKPSKPRKKK